MRPILIKGDDVRSGRKANACHSRLQLAQESMRLFHNCLLSCVHNCNDQSCLQLRFVLLRVKITKKGFRNDD